MNLTSPFEKRLLDLQLMARPEEAEEQAFLEEYMAWKAAGGPKQYEIKRDAERQSQLISHHRLNVELAKRL